MRAEEAAEAFRKLFEEQAARAERIPLIAMRPKLRHIQHSEVQKLANTADVMIEVVTMAMPTTRNVRRMAL